MKKFSLIAVALFLAPGGAIAAEAAGAAKGLEGAGLYFTLTVVTAGFSLAIATLCAAIGQGNVAGKAMEGIARQPEAAARIQTAMILGLAFIESLVIYALLIAAILLFMNPFKSLFVG